MSTATRAVIYARVSTDEQAEEGHSIDAQIRLCRELCERKGWNVIAEYIDPGESGTTTNRPGFMEMLRSARLRKFDIIVVHKLDRFSRSLVDALSTLARLSDQGVTLCSASEDFDFTTPIGRVLLALLVAFAQYFIDNLRVETKKGLKERVLKGYNNGNVPFGYERVLKEQGGVPVIHRKNITAYHQAKRMCLEGKNNREIADTLNAQGYRTSNGNFLIPDNIADMLRSRFYLGLVGYKGVWRPGKHPAVIDEETWELVQMSLRQRSSRRDSSKKKDRVYPLRKLAICATCGHSLRGQPSHGVRKYKDMESIAGRCAEPQTMPAAEIESQVGAFLLGATLPAKWQSQILLRVGAGTDAQHLETQRKRLFNELARARKLFVAGDKPWEEYEADKARIQLHLDKLKPLETLDYEKTAERLGSAGTLWEKATDAQRLELARALFEKIYIRGGAVVAIEPRAAFYPLLALTAEKTESPIEISDSQELTYGSDGRSLLRCVPLVILAPGSTFGNAPNE